MLMPQEEQHWMYWPALYLLGCAHLAGHHAFTIRTCWLDRHAQSPPLCLHVLAGLREGHEPYRHLATQAACAFLDTRSPHLVKAVPALVKPLRLALQTYEPALVGHALLMLQR
jgi:hypothetical protein